MACILAANPKALEVPRAPPKRGRCWGDALVSGWASPRTDARAQSRGAHTRKDHVARDDQNYLYHTLCHRDPAGPRLDEKAVTLGTWEPEERKY